MPSIPGRPGAIPTKINTTVPPVPSSVSTSALATPSPGKIKTRAENNAILHQKLAALRKKEQQKAAAGAETKSATPIQVKVTTPSEPLAVRTNGSTANAGQPQRTSSADPFQPTSKAADPAQRSVSAQPQPQTASQAQAQAQAQSQPTPKNGAIPGLLPTLQTTQAKPRVLKRPVASDFDGYSPNPSALKRSRTQETLIIDVSDDDDVEMEIGSPTDGPATSATPSNPPGHQTPLASHPPLSDSHGRKQRSSPVSTVQTPEKAGKLNLLHGRIEEMKRRIAEAEAKKKSAAKTSNEPQTPPTQPSPATEPVALPKALTPKKEERKPVFERRDRIASIDLPAVEAALKEKRDRLKELVSQASQLELDLQAAEAERQRLADEMKELGTVAEEDSIESSNQSLEAQNAGMCQMIDPLIR